MRPPTVAPDAYDSGESFDRAVERWARWFALLDRLPTFVYYVVPRRYR